MAWRKVSADDVKDLGEVELTQETKPFAEFDTNLLYKGTSKDLSWGNGVVWIKREGIEQTHGNPFYRISLKQHVLNHTFTNP